jgi:hypothetical protein
MFNLQRFDTLLCCIASSLENPSWRLKIADDLGMRRPQGLGVEIFNNGAMEESLLGAVYGRVV